MDIRTALTAFALLYSAAVAIAAERPYLREADEIATLRQGWTDDARAKVREKWAGYLALSDEQFWTLPPGPAVYRAMGVNQTEGCPKCGKAAYDVGGLWPFKCDILNKPWKVTCPNCGAVFPTNDFAAFYESGLDSRGYFIPEQADRSLLFNPERPAADDPLRTWGVDDGTGWVDEKGNRFWFIARYCGTLWTQLTRDARAMAEDYQRTGEPRLAHVVGILMARMADIHPDLNFTEQGVHPGDYKLGRDEGKAIWACGPYSEAGRMRDLLTTYDDIWEPIGADTQLVEFLTARCAQIGHPERAGSADAVRRHIESELILEGARDVMRSRAAGSQRYGGDVGHMEWTLALQGLVVDDPELKAELLAWPFQGPFPLKGGMHEVLCGAILGREGAGGSSSPGYSKTHYTMARTLADIYARLEGPEHRDLYALYPAIKHSYDSQFLLNCCEKYFPHIGDSSPCGSPGLTCNANTMLEAFARFGEPRYARMAYFLNKHSTRGFPEQVGAQVQAIVDEQGDWEQTATNLNGYGLSILRSGDAADDQRAAWLYYGRAVTNSHSHDDRLNIGLYAKRLDLMPDLGYPERTGRWPRRVAWTSNTLSHNTVVVDGSRQKPVVGGRMQQMGVSPIVQMVDVASEAVYPQTNLYRRQYAMIDIDGADSYLVDLFRVKGGSEHHYSFHSAEGDVLTEGLTLTAQPTGTLAGEDIDFGEYDPQVKGLDYAGLGYEYLRNVRRDTAPPPAFSVTWQVKDTWGQHGKGLRAETDVRLRLSMLGQHDEVIIATGEPPRLGKPSNPESLEYLLVHNQGENAASVYAAVVEPYQGERRLSDIRRLPVEPAADDVEGIEAVALQITHADGMVDYVLSAHDGSVERTAGGIRFAAEWALIRVRDGQALYAAMAGGTLLSGYGVELGAPAAGREGTISDFDREMDESNCIYTETDLPMGETLAGTWMRVENDGRQDACYEIKSVRREDGRSVIDLGDISLIRGVKNPEDYAEGYEYNVAVGDAFTIPGWTWAQRGADGAWQVRSNVGAR
ncbi:MAG TPA: hypothetical protein DGT21_08385 [Armatimonadetes bacterium]|nr:hypothetical protein [Armatimonadota bacterium]